MIIDGKKIAESIYTGLQLKVADLSRVPRLAVITCAPNFETQKYLALKEKKAHAVGIETRIIELTEENTTDDFMEAVKFAVSESDGVIVQLPLPSHIDTDAVLNAIPPSYDVDALNHLNTVMLSPVVGALYEILLLNDIDVREKYVTIIGSGRLVGLPASQWFTAAGAYVSVVTKDTVNISEYTKNADIVVCGAGVPDLLKPDMVKDGVIILDAGTSEDGGVLRGDADQSCAEKASLFTPVPGGIGPITIAILLRNVLDCARNRP
jgi:methylenetetrahydrofolate dehydrogenase (NADP+)/methenyltetrahydrofolate cyclohydrolase